MTQPDITPKPVVLCILDGWGYRQAAPDNAITLANTPNWDRFVAESPSTLIETSGLNVGLPDGQMGNSEVGHMNLGAGRVVMQDLPRIDDAIATDKLKDIPQLKAFITKAKAAGGCCHLMGLMSPGGVHSHQDHMVALVKSLDAAGIPVAIHAFLDGRDTPPSSAKDFIAKFEGDIADCKTASIATLTGRYFAMDRDKRWDRVELAYNAITSGTGAIADTAAGGIASAYANAETDEFVKPRVIGGYMGMKDGDVLLMANFRADRAREILTTFVDPDFDGFSRKATIQLSDVLGMVKYSDALEPFHNVLFPPEALVNVLGEVVAKAGRKQLRIAETEKYAHVTFFLNGGEEKVFNGEERILVPSPKVATYDLQPEMSALDVTDKLVAAIETNTFDLVVINFANGDMVGHTGIISAAVKAAEAVDACIGRLDAAVTKAGGAMIITADHGNAEQMKDPITGEPHTAHTVGPVRAILRHAPPYVTGFSKGRLCDIAPTLLEIMGIPQPSEMTGTSLITKG